MGGWCNGVSIYPHGQSTCIQFVTWLTHHCSVDSSTQTPAFASPAASTTISSNFSLDFTLPEAAASGTVKLTLTRSAGTEDSGSPHIITFASAFETAAQHTMTVPPLSGAASSGYEIASISSNRGTASDLVNGATYTVQLEYKDASSNPAASVEHSSIVVGEADGMGGMGSATVCLVCGPFPCVCVVMCLCVCVMAVMQ